MSAHGRLSIEQGMVSGTMHAGVYVDAAIVGDTAGFEFAADAVTVSVGPNTNATGERTMHAPITATFATTPKGMELLALKLLEALGAPAFTTAEWLRIVDACDLADASDLGKRIRDYVYREQP